MFVHKRGIQTSIQGLIQPSLIPCITSSNTLLNSSLFSSYISNGSTSTTSLVASGSTKSNGFGYRYISSGHKGYVNYY